jgi:hypothetical protein
MYSIQLRYKKNLEDERNNNKNNPTCPSLTFLEQNGYTLDKDTNLPKISQKNTQYYCIKRFDDINSTVLLNLLKNEENYYIYEEYPMAVVIEYENNEKEILFNYFNLKTLGEKIKMNVINNSFLNNDLEYTLKCLSKGVKYLYLYYFTFISKSPVKVTKFFYNKETKMIEAEYYSDFDEDDFLPFSSSKNSYHNCIIS